MTHGKLLPQVLLLLMLFFIQKLTVNQLLVILKTELNGSLNGYHNIVMEDIWKKYILLKKE